jgi:hypothetical protein
MKKLQSSNDDLYRVEAVIYGKYGVFLLIAIFTNGIQTTNQSRRARTFTTTETPAERLSVRSEMKGDGGRNAQ